MILIPCLLLASFPPGILFPQMAARMSASGRTESGEKGDPEKQVHGHGGQQQTASGDESGPSEATVVAEPAATTVAVEPKSEDQV